MAFPCCCSLSKGIRAAGLVSALLALAVCGVAGCFGWEAYEESQTEGFKAKKAIGEGTTSIFKSFGIEQKVDFVKINRIKLACYGVAFGAAALQLLTSLLILICPAAKSGKSTAKLYSFINPFVLIALLGAVGCFFSGGTGIDYENDRDVQYFLGVAVLDSVFLLYLLCVAGAFIRS
ncbi:hypothetical protein Ocin01_12548 [Orchesella cincta]|uniref:Transmembrane protein n=1 Tax=Orchesella cincta TaxID=48709 RepID=A0A1D2MMN3_ORCCI|nr:hypothetical protein Ocin01_12548 [Orchesella cincta]